MKYSSNIVFIVVLPTIAFYVCFYYGITHPVSVTTAICPPPPPPIIVPALSTKTVCKQSNNSQAKAVVKKHIHAQAEANIDCKSSDIHPMEVETTPTHFSILKKKAFQTYKGKHLVHTETPVDTILMNWNEENKSSSSTCSSFVNPTASVRKPCIAVVRAGIGNAYNRVRIEMEESPNIHIQGNSRTFLKYTNK